MYLSCHPDVLSVLRREGGCQGDIIVMPGKTLEFFEIRDKGARKLSHLRWIVKGKGNMDMHGALGSRSLSEWKSGKGAMNESECVVRKERCGQIRLGEGAEGGLRLGPGKEDCILRSSLGGSGEGAKAAGKGRPRWWQESSDLQDQRPRSKVNQKRGHI